MTLSIPPFALRLPAGFSLPGSAAGSQTASAPANPTAPTTASTTVTQGDVVSIGNTWDAGTFTAKAGDTYRLGDLIHGQGGTPGAIPAGYRIALSDPGTSGGGTLTLNGSDVTARTSFTAAEFAKLTYTAGTDGAQNLVVVAQTGKRLPNGTLTQIVDSPAIQITANVTGTRSISAMNALVTTPQAADANVVSVVKEAAVLTGIGVSPRPTLQTAGNFTAGAGDSYRLNTLFQGQGTSGTTPAGYRIALSDPGTSSGGTLTLNGSDVTARTSFTAAEFAKLTYTAGTGGAQNLVVVAQAGKRLPNGTLTQIVDSPALQITANVTGTRSINAMNALVTTPQAADANVVGIVKEAAILTGFGGSPRPTLQTAGNFTAGAGDIYRLADLFQGQSVSGTAPAGYRIALGDPGTSGGGTLTLNGTDVTARTSFTAAEFGQLTYTAGTDGAQSLVVVAQTGKRLTNGTLTQTVDSPAVEITANVTGTRSINAMNALITTPQPADANVVGIVKEAAILTGIGGSARPTLQTAGNFTADAGDTYRLSGLFQGLGIPPAAYRIALGDAGTSGGGTLTLNGTDVTSRTSFTAAEFAGLSYTAGTGGAQSLVVVAQTGKRLTNGTLTQIVDSPAVQITANVTGTRSVNALNALITTPQPADANVVTLVKEAAILTGIGGSARPTLRTAGNFTANAGDIYRLANLFQGQSASGSAPAAYRLALGKASGGGTLSLNGADVTSRTSFTAAEFAGLTYTAGTEGSQSLVVVAQTGNRLTNGTLTQIVDSPPVQITANVTGTRSINAIGALVTTPQPADANVVSIVKEAGILTGIGGSARPTLQTAGTPRLSMSPTVLSTETGAYTIAGPMAAGSLVDLSSFDPGAIGSTMSPGNFTNAGGSLAVALMLLDGTAIGAFQTINQTMAQSQTIKAYTTT